MGQRGKAIFFGQVGVVGDPDARTRRGSVPLIDFFKAVAFGTSSPLTASKEELEKHDGGCGRREVSARVPDQLRGMAAMLIPIGRDRASNRRSRRRFLLCSPWSKFRLPARC